MVPRKLKQVKKMDSIELVYLKTKLRNLERKYAKMIQHSDLTDIAIELKSEINELKNTIAMMQEGT